MNIPWAQIVPAVISGGGVGWAASFLNERSKGRAYTMGAVDQAVKVALESVTGEINRLNGELGKLRTEHKECHEKNEDLQNQINALQHRVQELLNAP